VPRVITGYMVLGLHRELDSRSPSTAADRRAAMAMMRRFLAGLVPLMEPSWEQGAPDERRMTAAMQRA
jgi:hypothetical protein